VSIEVTCEEYGDIIASKPDGDMTVAELIEALGHMPQDAIVRRYAEDWGVETVTYQHPSDAVDLS
jgi:hypothetical protein